MMKSFEQQPKQTQPGRDAALRRPPSSHSARAETPRRDEPVKLPFTPAKGESNRAFASFLAYFDIGTNRSLTHVAQLSGVSISSVKAWARKFQWTQRVCDYQTSLLQARLTVEADAHRDHAHLLLRRVTELKEKEWAAAEKCIAAAERILELTMQKPPEELRPSDAARLLEVASKLGRLACDMATEKTEHTGPNGGAFQIELEAALKKAYGEAYIPPALEDASPVVDVETLPAETR